MMYSITSSSTTGTLEGWSSRACNHWMIRLRPYLSGTSRALP
jgi:hypothetical protein